MSSVLQRFGELSRQLERTLQGIADDAFEAGALGRAELVYGLVLSLNDTNAAAFEGLRDVLHEFGEFERLTALQLWGVGKFPDKMHYYIAQLQLHLTDGDLARATELVDAAAAIDSSSFVVDYMRATILLTRQKPEEAEIWLRSALTKNPVWQQAIVDLARTLSDLNRKTEAIALLEHSLAARPHAAMLYASLASLGYFADKELTDSYLERMRALVAPGSGIGRSARIQLHFALGTALDSRFAYREAFRHFAKGNALIKNRSSAERLAYEVDLQIESVGQPAVRHLSRLHENDWGVDLAFIVGMPRSGSTLTEQILATHPDVRVGGECGYLRRVIRRLPELLGHLRSYPGCIPSLSRRDLETMRRDFYEAIEQEPGQGNSLFVSKALENYMHRGLIWAMFPAAKVIHCRRHPLDTCLSCFFQHFGWVNYANSLSKLAGIYRQYARMNEYWDRILPNSVLDVRYEEMVSNPGRQIARLLDFCGLRWEQECLEFHRTTRPALTCSAFQVKSPIHKKSMHRWVNYQMHIAELVLALGHDHTMSETF